MFGARPVKRALQRELQTLLAQALLRGEFTEGDTILVEAAPDNLSLTLVKAGAAAAKSSSNSSSSSRPRLENGVSSSSKANGVSATGSDRRESANGLPPAGDGAVTPSGGL